MIFQQLMDLLYPKTCPVCGEVLQGEKGKKVLRNTLCSNCKNKIIPVKSPVCKQCGKPIRDTKEEFCFDCRKRKKTYFVQGFAVWEYDKYMKNSITQFKYGGRKEYADFYIEEVVYYYGKRLSELQFDAVIPVPLHKDKLRFRGFNQAEILAKKLGEKLEINILDSLLCRVRNTKPQKGLDDKERYENIRQAFSVTDKESAKNLNRVLLVDDIYTTGTTINQCAAELVKAGTKEVYFLCLCIGSER